MAIGYDVVGRRRGTMEISVRFDINLFSLILFILAGEKYVCMMGENNWKNLG
jgi:hypothetical protein